MMQLVAGEENRQIPLKTAEILRHSCPVLPAPALLLQCFFTRANPDTLSPQAWRGENYARGVLSCMTERVQQGLCRADALIQWYGCAQEVGGACARCACVQRSDSRSRE